MKREGESETGAWDSLPNLMADRIAMSEDSNLS